MKVSKGSSETSTSTRENDSSPENPAERVTFTLSGRSLGLDHRLHAYRDDVADIALAGKVLAHYYAVPVMRYCAVDIASIYEQPEDDAVMTSQLLEGEGFAVVDSSGGWTWGFCEHDHYVGYIRDEALTDAQPSAAHKDAMDPVKVAENLVDTPYLWGGRTAAGIDCSGLVQWAFSQAGHALPRDSDMQLDIIETDVPADALLQRGDIVFFPNHVGIMADADMLIHATQHWGKTVKEPLADVIARIAKEHNQPVTGRKRILS